MGKVRVESGSRSLQVVVEVYERGVAGQSPVLVETHALAAAADIELGETRFAVVREGMDSDGKSIDNWFTAPTPDPQA